MSHTSTPDSGTDAAREPDRGRESTGDLREHIKTDGGPGEHTETVNDPGEHTETDGGYVAAQTASDDEYDSEDEYALSVRSPAWIRHVRTVATTEYRLAVRGRWAFALTGLFALFGVMLATFSGSAVGPEGMERVIASLTSLAVYLVPLAALSFGYDAIVGRDEQGWLDVIFALPVSRASVVVGTYLGRATVLGGATVLGFGVTGALLLGEFGVTYWGSFLAFLAASVAVGAAFLSIAVLLSTIAGEKTHALGAALAVWVWFVLIHDLLSLGLVAAFALPDAVLSGLVLVNPASVFRILVLSGLGTTTGGGFTAALAETALSNGVLAVALVAWCVVPIALASRLVARRRL
ncbi:MAG: ABC transporter permease [Halobacteriota archaeon]